MGTLFLGGDETQAPLSESTGPLVSHPTQTPKPGEKLPGSTELGTWGVWTSGLSRGPKQHLRPRVRAVRQGRTGRCPRPGSREQRAHVGGGGVSSKPAVPWGGVAPWPQGARLGAHRWTKAAARPGARAETQHPPPPCARPGLPPAAASRVPISPWAARAG